MTQIAYGDFAQSSSDNSAPPIIPTSVPVSDMQKLAANNEVQYTKPKPPPEPNLGERLTEDVEKPAIQATHTIGQTMSWMGQYLKDDTPFGGLGDRLTKMGLVTTERTQQLLKDKFSNFTPNMWDNAVGAVPTIGAILGLGWALTATAGPAVGAATITGLIAGAGGVGAAAEEFQKFKDQGISTGQSTALAAAVGVPYAGALALGFGVVGKMVEPWFGQMLKGTIGKLIGDKVTKFAAATLGNATAAGTAGLVTAGVKNTLDYATEVAPGNEKDLAVQKLADTAQAGIFSAVLASGLGLQHTMAQHNKLIQGFKDIGMDGKMADQAATDVMGQGAHVLMDRIEQHLKYTADENARIKTTPSSINTSVQPNILDRSQIPKNNIEDQFPSLGEEKTHEQVTQESAPNKYVKLEPLSLKLIMKPNAVTGLPEMDSKLTTEDLRYRFVGGKGLQLLRGNYLAVDMEKIAPGEGSVSFIAKQYTPDELQKVISDPEGYAKFKLAQLKDKIGKGEMSEFFTPGTTAYKIALQVATDEFKVMKPLFEKALNPSDGVKAQIGMADQYYEEQGKVSLALGTLQDVIKNYVNRVYKPNLPTEFTQVAGKAGLPLFSPHSLSRFYDDPLMAIAAGMRFSTMDLPSLVAIHNQEMTGVNYGRQMADELSKIPNTPLGKWVKINAVPGGWKAYEGMTKDKPYQAVNGDLGIDRQVFASPIGIHSGLKPLVEPDWLRSKFPLVAKIQDIQAYIKTGWLGLSTYHDVTFMQQTLASVGGAKTLATLPQAMLDGTMEAPAFRDKEGFWVKRSLTTPAMSKVQDIRMEIEEKGENWEKFLNTPIVKQINDISEAHTKFLFGPYQRWIKVNTAQNKYDDFIGKNPSATPEELESAARQIARTTNDDFGGQNFEALGISKSSQSLMRLTILAPDWCLSMVRSSYNALSLPSYEETMQGIDLNATERATARATLTKAVMGGYAIGDAMNFILTGHHMFQNKKGHWFQVQLGENDYWDPVRGGPGELLKALGQTITKGIGQGLTDYVENKAAPFMSNIISASQKGSSSIWKGHSNLEKTVNGVWNLASRDIPIPFSIRNSFSYAKTAKDKTPLGWGGVLSGNSRYSPPPVPHSRHKNK